MGIRAGGFAFLFCAVVFGPASPAFSQTLEDGVAITDPAVVAHLQATRFSAGAILFPGTIGSSQFKNDNLFKGKLKAVATQLIQDITTLPDHSLDTVSRTFFADSGSKGHRFSAQLLTDKRSGFVLTGVVNRMDRAYRVVDGVPLYKTCGEVRFLYRFTYDVTVDGREVASRLPFTMSIVLNTRDPDEVLNCADIAKRWLGAGAKTSPDELIKYLDSKDGPLVYLHSSQVDRIEVNLQLFRVPAGVKTDFGGNAEYLLRIFRRAAPTAPFVATPLENQVDRSALLANARILDSFKKWLFGKAAIAALDTGTLDIPQQYLATRAISVSPGSTSRTENQPFLDLFSDPEIKAAIENYLAASGTLKSIKSIEAFKRRLNDISCSGCHQTRAIAGFHFPGSDPDSEPAANAVHVPGSAHFFSDLPRRKKIIADFASGIRPDFSRTFSGRADNRYRQALAGTQLVDGWGAVCYMGDDPSFTDWTCSSGLTCKKLDSSPINPQMGTCVTANKIVVDPMEFGAVKYATYGDDSYKRTIPADPAEPDDYVVPPAPIDRSDYVVAHQGFRRVDSTGGFPAGMLRIEGCKNLPGEAVCGRVAGSGFNDCIASGKPFPECLEKTKLAGLRSCSKSAPCREDYICTAPYKDLGGGQMGTCIPPYFMFQFRVDGHPESFRTQELYGPESKPLVP
jgi:hypothetical protein